MAIKGLKRMSRKDLTRKIILRANLPKGKVTEEYFTKEQLIHLLLLINTMDDSPCSCNGRK